MSCTACTASRLRDFQQHVEVLYRYLKAADVAKFSHLSPQHVCSFSDSSTIVQESADGSLTDAGLNTQTFRAAERLATPRLTSIALVSGQLLLGMMVARLALKCPKS